jgi:hypothetical protein
MLAHLFHITNVSVSGAERLYPNGIDWALAPGVNVILGGTGLGKTTLSNAIFFGLFGDLQTTRDDTEALRADYFKERFKPSNEPTVRVTARFGESLFEVERTLVNGRIRRLQVDREDISPKQYESLVCGALGVADFANHIKRLVDHLLYVGEDRYLVAWDNRAQNEIINLLLGSTEDFDELYKLWETASSADSRFRNIRYQLHTLEKELDTLQEGVETSRDTVVAERQALEIVLRDAELRRENAKANVDAERLILAELEPLISIAGAELGDLAGALEADSPTDPDGVLHEFVFKSPSADSLYWMVRGLAEAKGNRDCPSCLRRPRETRDVQRLLALIHRNSCPICGLDLASAMPSSTKALPIEPTKDLQERGAELSEELHQLIVKVEAARSRVKIFEEDHRRAEEDLRVARENKWVFDSKNPAAPRNAVEQRKAAVAAFKERLAENEKIRKTSLSQFQRAQKRLLDEFEKIFKDFAKEFAKYCALYLDEKCTVELDLDGLRAKGRGPHLRPPHAAFWPVVAGVARYRSQTLSEAQRQFVDIAFRMAVLELWRKRTKSAATILIETPEGAVDVAYMARVASMIKDFAERGHTVIVTSNLNNDTFLPALMKNIPRKERAARMLNLIEKGHPRNVQIEAAPLFEDIVRKTLAA